MPDPIEMVGQVLEEASAKIEAARKGSQAARVTRMLPGRPGRQ